MVEFFEIINPTYCFVLSAFFIAMIVVSFASFKKYKNYLFLMIGLVSVGLFYDTFITGLGYQLHSSSAFYIVGMMRHVCHALLTPLVLVFCLKACNNCGVFLHKAYKYAVYAISAVLAIGAIIAIFTSPVDLIDYGGVIRHSIDKDSAFFLSALVLKSLSYGMLFPMFIASFVTIKKCKDFNLLWGTIGMLLFTIIGVIINPDLIFMISFVGEALLAFFFYYYAYKYEKKKS